MTKDISEKQNTERPKNQKLVSDSGFWKMLKRISLFTSKLFLCLFVLLIMFASVRGNFGNPTPSQLNSSSWREDGPLELSPERGRFALLYSLVEDESFYFSVDLARFVLPDLGYINGNFVSLFAPGTTYLALPGYLLGKSLGVSQVGTFLVISVFAILNTYLIAKIAQRLGASVVASTIAGLAFLFATPAFAYAVNLYQHHISTFLILMALYLLVRWNNFISLALIWFLCAASIPIDYPNLILMFPIGIYAFTQFFNINNSSKKIQVSLRTPMLLSLITILLPLSFFLWFNLKSYNNPIQLSGTVGNVNYIDENGIPGFVPEKIDFQNVGAFVENEKTTRKVKTALGFFEPRLMLEGLYVLLASPDRGIVTFAPIVLLGIVGAWIFYSHNNRFISVLLGILVANIILYSMWGDPWGGWAFGSRYLIPAYAILAILLSFALTRFRKNVLFIIPFTLLLFYSVFVNTLGAITTSTMPPKIQTLELEKVSGKRERYSFDRNWEFINNGKSKSFVYQSWAHNYVSSVQYFYILAGSIILVSTLLVGVLMFQKNHEKEVVN